MSRDARMSQSHRATHDARTFWSVIVNIVSRRCVDRLAMRRLIQHAAAHSKSKAKRGSNG
jgi:hypothetical protein